MSNNQLAYGNISDDDGVIIIDSDTESANNDSPAPEAQEISDDEIEVVSVVKLVPASRYPEYIPGVRRSELRRILANRPAEDSIYVDLTQSDEEPEAGEVVDVAADRQAQPEPDDELVDEMEEDDDLDVEGVNIDVSSTESMLSFIMRDKAQNAPSSSSQTGTSNEASNSRAGRAPSTSGNDVTNTTSSSQAGSSTQPSTSDPGMAPTTSGEPVGVPQMKKKSAASPSAPTPAKRRCLRRSTESIQNRRNLPRISHPAAPPSSPVSVGLIPVNRPSTSGPAPTAQRLPRRSKKSENQKNVPAGSDNQIVAPSSSPTPVVPVPLTLGSGSALPVRDPPRRPMRAAAVPKTTENKENVPAGSEPGPSSSKPAAKPSAKPVGIGAAIQGEDEGPKRFYFPRTPAVPTGLTRCPFNGALPKDIKRKCEYRKIMRKLKIQKVDDFPESTLEGQMIESVLVEKEKPTHPEDGSKNDPKGVATLEEYLGDEPSQEYMDADNQEELIWSAEKLEEELEGHKRAMDEFYKAIEEKYLLAVWRQFESRIPLEYALQNLQKEKYSIPAALRSIDEYLKKLPQKMKNPSAAQVQYMAKEYEDNGRHVDLSWIQDNVMRNYHMAEIHCFFYRFGKFFKVPKDKNELSLRVGCNCRQVKCRPLLYVPRYGCANCTNRLRKHKLPAQNLCLLCSTQQEISGALTPVENVVLDADDLEKIKKWDEEAPGMSRKDFEKWSQEQKNERYKKLQLTQEEVLMLDFEKLSVTNLAEQVTAQLQPYVLPHFSMCRCRVRMPVANPPPEIPEL